MINSIHTWNLYAKSAAQNGGAGQAVLPQSAIAVIVRPLARNSQRPLIA
jgi:hypothetical protein